MTSIRALLICFGLAGCAHDQGPWHVADPVGSHPGAATVSHIDQRLKDSAVEYQEYAPVPRMALFDVALPADQDEYDHLGGFGVVLITVVVQEPAEIPPKRVFAHFGKDDVTLRLIRGAESPIKDASISTVLGNNRWDGFYEIPVYLLLGGATLVMDFAETRTGFEFGSFDPQTEKQNAKSLKVARPLRQAAPEEDLDQLINREFPGFLQSASNKT